MPCSRCTPQHPLHKIRQRNGGQFEVQIKRNGDASDLKIGIQGYNVSLLIQYTPCGKRVQLPNR